MIHSLGLLVTINRIDTPSTVRVDSPDSTSVESPSSVHESGEGFDTTLSQQKAYLQDGSVNLLASSVATKINSVSRTVPLPGSPGAYLSFNTHEAASDAVDTPLSNSNSKPNLSLGIDLNNSALSRESAPSYVEYLKSRIETALKSAIGVKPSNLDFPQNFPQQLAAVNDKFPLSASHPSPQWRFSPQIVATLSNVDLVRGVAQIWAQNAAISPYALQKNTSSITDTSKPLTAPKMDTNGKVSLGFSLTGANMMVFGRYHEDTQSFSLGILNRDPYSDFRGGLPIAADNVSDGSGSADQSKQTISQIDTPKEVATLVTNYIDSIIIDKYHTTR